MNTFTRHWEKFAMLGVAVAMPLSIGLGRGSGAEMSALDESAAIVATNRARMLDATPVSVGPTRLEREIVAAADMPAWAGSFSPPGPVVIEEPAKPRKSIALAPAILKETRPLPGSGIEVTWLCDLRPRGDLIKVLLSSHWIVERREGDGEWKRVGRVDNVDGKGTCRFVDTKVDHRTLFTYRILPESIDASWQAPPRETVKIEPAASNVIAARGPSPWRLAFNNAHESAGDDDPSTVQVRVFKFDRDFGPVEAAHVFKVGEKIGEWPEVTGGAAVTTHSLFCKWRCQMVPVDLDTGFRITAIKFNQARRYVQEICTPADAEECARVASTDLVGKATVIEYRGEDKAVHETVLWDYRISDRHCWTHMAEEERETRRAGAVAELDAAEQLWRTQAQSNRRQAQDDYAAILRKYPHVPDVKRVALELRKRIGEQIR